MTTESDTPTRGHVVVIGIDGSETSWDALSWACGEAQRLHARAVAVFVGPTTETKMMAAGTALAPVGDYACVQKLMAEQAAQLKDEVERFASERDLDLTFVHTQGEVAKELLRVAETYSADLVVVGQSTKAIHHLAGSLGRRLVGKRGVPVIAVVP
jgi:nucleotide-binding universal stress UspA family protein